MRLALIAGAVMWLGLTGLAGAQEVAEPDPIAEESAPRAPESESSAPAAARPFADFDPSTLPSLLGQFLSQSPRRDAAPGTAVPPESKPVQPGDPAGVPPAASGAPVYSRHAARREAFRARLYAKRMALVERIRVAAEQSGDEKRAAQAEQLGVLVTKVHTEGLGSLVQMLGQLQAARQSPEPSSSSPPEDVPEVEFGAPAPLPTDEAPTSEPGSSTAPPEPRPDEGPELPPSP